eukprot:TRINITY_DN16373_c0_g2_i1.p1 TRINITY_DN16373_c0_g2~~TRINITY_DN16373_c0_g2_i1.p1  ORF type:complete len:754 (-),score=131.37 TRINITY_DN16373_c0_g2_i1:70-2331(-)
MDASWQMPSEKPSSTRTFIAQVPADVRPGESMLEARDDCGGAIRILAPREVLAGDRLMVEQNPDGSFGCRISRAAVGLQHAAANFSSAVDSVRRRMHILVPPGAVPGVTTLNVKTVSDSEVKDDRKMLTLRIQVPANASVGDKLILEQDGAGCWGCTLDRAAAGEPNVGADSASLTQESTSTEGPLGAGDVVHCKVPSHAVPGETLLEVDGKSAGEVFRAVVPDLARSGDLLELRRALNLQGGSQTNCQARVVCPLENEMGKGFGRALLDVEHDDKVYEQLAANARTIGLTVSTKMARGSVPPLHIPGLVARQRIEIGEEIVIVPASVVLLPSSLRRVLKEIYEAVEALTSLSSARIQEHALAACVGVLLQRAAARHASSSTEAGRCDVAAGAVTEENASEDEVLNFWIMYAEALLMEDFSAHPYSRAAEAFLSTRHMLEPSKEHLQYMTMVKDIYAVHQILSQSSCGELAAMELKFFFHARLLLLTRMFKTTEGAALVPITDLCNHDAALETIGAEYVWDDKRRAHVLTARKTHEAGEEILTSYGPRSNVLLFRTYGFTVPSEVEPSWGYVVQWERPMDIFAKCISPELHEAAIQLETWQLMDSLALALNACNEFGAMSPADFLKELCSRCLESYNKEECLRPAIEALRRARAVDPGSAAWWDQLPPDYTPPLAPEGWGLCRRAWGESVLRIKMSEYLSLIAHLEALEWYAGRVPEDQCLRDAAALRSSLGEGLRLLASGHAIKLQSSEDLI